MEPISNIAHNSLDDIFIAKLSEFVENNLDNNDLNVDLLAREMGMGRSNFFAKVKAVSDMTPNDFIRLTRLKNSAPMLIKGELSISQVCFAVGFTSPSYFSKCFHKQFGISPTDFIKNRGGSI